MLPKKHTIRALRLARSYGEIRVGVLNHDTVRAIGPEGASPFARSQSGKSSRKRYWIEIEPMRKD